MPSKTGKTPASYYKSDVSVEQSTNVGFDSTPRSIISGDGAKSSISLSDDVLSVQPVNDDSVGSLLCKNSGGNNILAVDTTNSKVLLGASQVPPTNYAYFGIDSGTSVLGDDTHYAIPFIQGTSTSHVHPMGTATTSSFNDTNPATSLTITTSAQIYINSYWFVMDDITIDAVKWFHAADNATGSTTVGHLMAYTVDIANGSTGGDLSSGVVVADGATITNAGNEQIYYQSMTIQSADVDAGKVIMFTFAFDDQEGTDYSINATVKYHIR